MFNMGSKERGRNKSAGVAALIVLSLIFGGCAQGDKPVPSATPGVQPLGNVTTLPVPNPQAGPQPVADMVALVSPAVVGVTISGPARSALGVDTQMQGLGTGVIVDPQGYVLTNNHVTEGATQIAVVMSDGTQKPAKQLWNDPVMDLAILQIQGGETFRSVRMGDSGSVRVGDVAVAIGTPLTLQFQHTVTQGIISAKNRTLQVPTEQGQNNIMEDLLQTDTSINPGNSGGPLLNLSGEVVGINTVKVTSAEGIGFAIPIDVARPIVEHFVAEGKYTTPYIGVFAVDHDMARYYEEFESWMPAEGLLVLESDPYGPGFSAGIRTGDVLQMIDGKAITRMLDLRVAMYQKRVGDTLELTVMRGGGANTQTMKVTVKLVASPVGA